MNYKPYAKTANTPSRKTRKSERRSVFTHNKFIAKQARKARRLAKRDAL